MILVASALALDLQWWGVGPVIGTTVAPTRYPTAFPYVARDKVDEVRGDVDFGLHGVIYPGKAGRVFGRLTLGVGTSGYFGPEFVLGYDAIVVKDEELQVLAGLGIGAGGETFRSAGENDFLRVAYYPLRGQLSMLLRDKARAYEVAIWGDYHIAGVQEYCTSADGECTTAGEAEEAIGGAVYFGLGAEATLYFGDFKNKSTKSARQR